jgi:hypothetical protein
MFLWLNKCGKAYARMNGCLVVSQDSESQFSQTTTGETLRDRRINKTRCDNSNAFFITVPMIIMATVTIVEEMEAERCSIRIHLRIRHCRVIDTNMKDKDKSRSGVDNAREPTCDKCGKTGHFISKCPEKDEQPTRVQHKRKAPEDKSGGQALINDWYSPSNPGPGHTIRPHDTTSRIRRQVTSSVIDSLNAMFDATRRADLRPPIDGAVAHMARSASAHVSIVPSHRLGHALVLLMFIWPSPSIDVYVCIH